VTLGDREGRALVDAYVRNRKLVGVLSVRGFKSRSQHPGI